MTYFPPEMFMRSPYIFIDGANAVKSFSDFVCRYWPGDEPSIDWKSVSAQFHKLFFYDALPVRAEGQDDAAFAAKLSAAQQRILAISQAPDSHVRTGLTRAEGRRGRLQQKGVDIQLCVDALSMAHRGAFAKAIIWTSDLDFLPLFEELVLMGVTVTLWYPPSITSETLKSSADRAEEITPSRLYDYMTAEWRAAHPFPRAELATDAVWNGTIPVRWPAQGDPQFYFHVADDQISAVWLRYRDNLHLQIHGASANHILMLAQEQFGAAVPEAVRPEVQAAYPEVVF